MIHNLPTWAIAILVCGAFVLLTMAALAPVNRLWPVLARNAHNEIAGFIIAVVGVLYAVLLASVALLALETFINAEQTVQREAELLSDLYRSAEFLPRETALGLRADLREYGEVVVEEEWPTMRQGARPEAGWPVLERMQSKLVAYQPATPGQEIAFALFLEDLGQLYDARRDRIFLAFRGLQPVVWAVVIAGALSTLAFSLFFGVDNVRAHMGMAGMLAFSLSLVFVLILAVDQPLRGDSQIEPHPFEFVLTQFDRLDRPPPSE